MARENPLWGAGSMRGELLKLDIQVAKRTVQKYMRAAHSRLPADPSWATFLWTQGHDIWVGYIKTGRATALVPSGALEDVTISAGTRFGSDPGSDPEELVAAAHASCFSMQLSALLSQAGHPPEEIRTQATLSMRRADGEPRK